MSKRKNNGIVRRPAEYFLIAVIVGLVVSLLLINNFISRQYSDQSDNSLLGNQWDQPVGSIDEINASLESEFISEEKLQNHSNSYYDRFKSFQAAADDAGSVFDESEY